MTQNTSSSFIKELKGFHFNNELDNIKESARRA